MLWVALVGCEFEVFTFTVVEETETAIEGVDAPETDELISLDELVDLDGIGDDALAEAGVKEGDISQLRLLELTFTVVEPSDADLNFLQSVEVWLSADGLDDVQIASRDEVPEDTTELTLDVSGVDLAPYLFGEGLEVSTFAAGNYPAEDMIVRTKVAVEVGVSAQGAFSQLTGR